MSFGSKPQSASEKEVMAIGLLGVDENRCKPWWMILWGISVSSLQQPNDSQEVELEISRLC